MSKYRVIQHADASVKHCGTISRRNDSNKLKQYDAVGVMRQSSLQSFSIHYKEDRRNAMLRI